MLNFNASSYNSFAKTSETPARIIKIASAPLAFAKDTCHLSIKKSLHKIGKLIFANLILAKSEAFPLK